MREAAGALPCCTSAEAVAASETGSGIKRGPTPSDRHSETRAPIIRSARHLTVPALMLPGLIRKVMK
jgi:hypothetical protein